MISLQTLQTIEALLMSKSDPRWGEFMVLGQCIQEVQQAKQALIAARTRPASPPGPTEPPTPVNHVEVG